MLEKEMATHSSILAWRIPWTEDPGGLQFMGLQRVGHDWATEHSVYVSILFSQFVAPLLPLLCPKSVLYVCISISALQKVHQYHFYSFHIYALIQGIFLFLTYFILYNKLYVQPLHENWLRCVPFYGCVIFHCICVPQHLYIFLCWWTSRLLPRPNYCK